MTIIRLSNIRILLLLLLLLLPPYIIDAIMLRAGGSIAVARYRRDYEKSRLPKKLCKKDPSMFSFGRFQSPDAVQRALLQLSKFHYYHDKKDGRHGYVSTTKLSGDWVLAQSKQLAVDCTTQEVIRTYLSGRLQTQWNAASVLECRIAPHRSSDGEAYYQQDLVLRSQRVIRSHTGVMRYSQRIVVDKIGQENYCVAIQLMPDDQATTDRKPFNALNVYVSLQQNGNDVSIYAAGIMKVNRQVVPNLVVFDASGIAGNMAGRGTLWLAAHFAKKKQQSGATFAKQRQVLQ